MKNVILCGLIGGVVLTGAAIAAQGTQQPGQVTQARVWIENRSKSEAIPVTLQEIAPDAALRVQVTNSATVVQSRAARQPWDYQQILVGPGQNAAALLTAAGADGWETTGVQLPATGGTLIVLKRPR